MFEQKNRIYLYNKTLLSNKNCTLESWDPYVYIALYFLIYYTNSEYILDFKNSNNMIER